MYSGNAYPGEKCGLEVNHTKSKVIQRFEQVAEVAMGRL